MARRQPAPPTPAKFEQREPARDLVVAEPHSEPAESTSRRRTIGLVLFWMLLVLYVWPIDIKPGANVYAHIDQAVAVAADGTLAIDRFLGPHGNTVDWSRAPSGHYYPAKAPGAGLSAAPVAWLLYRVELGVGVDPLDHEWFRRNAVIINWLLNALVSAYAMTVLFKFTMSMGIATLPGLAGTIAVALGTAYYPYATTYYAHVPATNAIIGAASLIFVTTSTPLRDAAAGVLAGLAVVFDYPAFIGVIVLAGSLTYLRPRAVVPFSAGVGLALAVVLWYNAVVFGNPFSTAYTYQNPEFAAAGGGFLDSPHLRVLASLTVSPYRGIFVFSPVLFIGLYGCLVAMRQTATTVASSVLRQRRAISGAALTMLGLSLLLNVSYRTWWGGWTAGPRFMIPSVVLFGPLIALGAARLPRVSLALISVSILNYIAITAVAVVPSDKFTNPLRQVIYPQFIHGNFERSNVGMFFGLHGFWSLLPPIVIAMISAIVLWRLTASIDGHSLWEQFTRPDKL